MERQLARNNRSRADMCQYLGRPASTLQGVLYSLSIERIDEPGGVADQHDAIKRDREPVVVGDQRPADDLAVLARTAQAGGKRLVVG
jgi:hypothetical protein